VSLTILGLAVLLGGGAIALLVSRSRTAASSIGATTAVLGCGLLGLAVVEVLAAGLSASISWSWSMPGGHFGLRLDALSALFLIPILVLGALSAVYALGSLEGTGEPVARGLHWLWFNLLIACMALVVLAQNGVLFLLAWEGMAISSYFLVNQEFERKEVRSAGFTYLVATHLGTAALLVLFTVLGVGSGSFEFSTWHAGPAQAGVLFLLALVGFGSKAGIAPLHVWLPEAHPSAPSHVSALMSGAMIKTGVYGLLRFLALLGPPAAWWGHLLIVLGLLSGLLGVLFALAQHDLKRLLAYHSVENIGIILLGVGLGVLGWATHREALAVLGFAGALLHVVNHALFKGLLFLGAGSVLHATGTREMDSLGGLLKRMPWTGLCFLVGAAAICALPPLNGFASEFLIYMGALHGTGAASISVAATTTFSMALLALIGGLAVACFTKAVGIVFLGNGRSSYVSEAHEAPAAMCWPMAVLAGACVAVGVFAGPLVRGLPRAVHSISGVSLQAASQQLGPVADSLGSIAEVGLGIAAAALLLALLRRMMQSRRPPRREQTWSCGYANPTPRMQYTSSSFAQPLVDLVSPFLRTERSEPRLASFFTVKSSFSSHTPDLFRRWLFEPSFRAVARGASLARGLQSGSTSLYVFYMVLTLAFLLFYAGRGS